MNHWNRTAPSACTCSTRTTSSPATARCCTRCRSPGRPVTTGRRLRAVVIGFGATARGAVTALNALGVARRRRPHPPRDRGRRLTDPLGTDRALRQRRLDGAGQPRGDGRGPRPARGVPRRARHHRQLRAAGHRRPADLHDRRRPRGRWRRAPWSSTSPATRAWGSAGLGRRRSTTRPSWSATTCSTTRSTTARRTSGTPRPGRTARRCCPSCATVIGGPEAWDADATIRRAIEIRDGVIQNPAILSFQDRAPQHPHWPLAT